MKYNCIIVATIYKIATAHNGIATSDAIILRTNMIIKEMAVLNKYDELRLSYKLVSSS